jgi:5-methylcytosine-specific restriction endonuclease McrA
MSPVLRQCPRHRTLSQGRCPQCVNERKVKQHIWNSSAWQTARNTARLRDGNVCQECGETEGLSVHHRIPLAAGGTNALSNLITLCARCHWLWEQGRGVGSDRDMQGKISQPATFPREIM